jgi:hypothetical protein
MRSKSTTMSAPSSEFLPDDRLPHGGRPVRPCEFERAYADLLAPRTARPRARAVPCSPESPEERGFPEPPAGARNYSLCNGHLRDLFTGLEELRGTGDSP